MFAFLNSDDEGVTGAPGGMDNGFPPGPDGGWGGGPPPGGQYPGGNGWPTQGNGLAPGFQHGYPEPIYDYGGWTPWQRETNGRLQAIFHGRVYDGIAPSFSERYKEGFSEENIPGGSKTVSPGMFGLAGGAVLKGMLRPFSVMSDAEGLLEHAIGKQIWDRPSRDELDDWWRRNTD